jgi:hypothetical protein
MATVWELRRFVPGGGRRKGGMRRRRGGASGQRGEQTFEDDAERTLADLAADAVVDADEVCGGGGVLGHGGERRAEGGQGHGRPGEE